MSFAEKLTFLMHITETSNKELAAELSVDPSMISLLRTGKRKLPKNNVLADSMAHFFAEKASAGYQRQAISETLGKMAITSDMPPQILEGYLGNWLKGKEELADIILSGINDKPDSKDIPAAYDTGSSGFSSSGDSTLFFYGEEGRRKVMSLVMDKMSRMSEPGTILTVIDDNLEWMLSDYLLTRKIQANLMEIMKKGFTFCQIMPPLNYINRYAESLKFWLPVYATGKTKVYYYPRLRGNLYRHSIIVVPGQCVQYSASVAAGSTNDITMFSTDPALVSAFEKQFYEHLSLCRPSLYTHHYLKEAAPPLKSYFEEEGEVIQLLNTLSVNTLTPELIDSFIPESDEYNRSTLVDLHVSMTESFENKVKRDRYIDMCYLASAKEIREGKAHSTVILSDRITSPVYTPETYCAHLKHIVELIDRYENYCFVPMKKVEVDNYLLFTSESGLAIIGSTENPITLLEVRRPAMVTALREFLYQKAEAAEYTDFYRNKIRMQLKALIQELEEEM